MASNFSFLRTQFPGLEKTGEFAERYLYSDSNSCLFKLGLLCEDIVNKMFDFDNIAMPYQMKDTLVNKIRLLENEEYITEDLARIMHRLRLGGNEARHEGTDSLQKAKLLLPQAYSLILRIPEKLQVRPHPLTVRTALLRKKVLFLLPVEAVLLQIILIPAWTIF